MVAKKTACVGIPATLKMLGLTNKIYDIAKNVVSPAIISVETVVLCSFSLKNLSIFFFFSLFTPTRNDAILIIGGGKTLDYIQSVINLTKIPNQSTELIQKFLQKEIFKIDSGAKK